MQITFKHSKLTRNDRLLDNEHKNLNVVKNTKQGINRDDIARR